MPTCARCGIGMPRGMECYRSLWVLSATNSQPAAIMVALHFGKYATHADGPSRAWK